MRDMREVLAEAVRVGEPRRVAELTQEQALEALEVLAVLRVATVERVSGGASLGRIEVGSGTQPPDQLLTAQEVAEVLRCSVAQVYRQAPRWPFARKLSHKTLRFSELGLRQWLAKQRQK